MLSNANKVLSITFQCFRNQIHERPSKSGIGQNEVAWYSLVHWGVANVTRFCKKQNSIENRDWSIRPVSCIVIVQNLCIYRPTKKRTLWVWVHRHSQMQWSTTSF